MDGRFPLNFIDKPLFIIYNCFISYYCKQLGNSIPYRAWNIQLLLHEIQCAIKKFDYHKIIMNIRIGGLYNLIRHYVSGHIYGAWAKNPPESALFSAKLCQIWTMVGEIWKCQYKEYIVGFKSWLVDWFLSAWQLNNRWHEVNEVKEIGVDTFPCYYTFLRINWKY
jgi:hypothetical protein